MSQLFISYSSQDRAFAYQLGDALVQKNYTIWLDQEDIRSGEKWSSAIQRGLETSDLMVLIVSPDSMASKNVEDEWQYFLDHDKPIIPIYWRTTHQKHFQINRLQYIDFRQEITIPIVFEEALDQLTQDLALHLPFLINNSPAQINTLQVIGKSKITSEEWFNRGQESFEAKNYEIAIECFSYAIELDPTLALAYRQRGKGYVRLGYFNDAIENFTSAIYINPYDAENYSGRGFAYYCKDQYGLAIANYTEAIRLDPNNPAFYCSRAEVYMEKKFYPMAIEDYNRAILCCPDDELFEQLLARAKALSGG